MPLHKKNRLMSSHLSESLYLKHHKRSFPIKKGDIVKVLRGSFKGHSGKIVDVDREKYRIAIDGVTLAKTDGTQVQFWVHPSNLLITKLDLSDKWRRQKLAVSEEDFEMEEKIEKREEATEKETKKAEEIPEKEDEPNSKWKKKELEDYAKSQNIEIKSSDTKKDILKKIENQTTEKMEEVKNKDEKGDNNE